MNIDILDYYTNCVKLDMDECIEHKCKYESYCEAFNTNEYAIMIYTEGEN